jgi:hypothetical protein
MKELSSTSVFEEAVQEIVFVSIKNVTKNLQLILSTKLCYTHLPNNIHNLIQVQVCGLYLCS